MEYIVLGIFCICVLIILLIRYILKNLTDIKHHKELKVAYAALEKANSAKQDFLSQMSHDIRTPMNSIIGNTALALEENDIDKVHEYLEQIQLSSEFMLGLLNDILDMAKIESNKIVLHEEYYELQEFLDYLNAVIKPLFDSRNINFQMNIKVDDDLIIITDKLRFNQIFFNLLSNASKYTKPDGKASIHINEVNREGDFVHFNISISDNGIGMSQEFLHYIFDPFAQENNKYNNEMVGTGLGMAIVKNLVDLMNGKIEVFSVKGEGTTFVLKLSFRYVHSYDEKYKKYLEEKEQIIKGEEIIFNDKHILLCEDNEINIIIYKKLLEKIGLIVDCAENGVAGLELFLSSEENYYSMILMDVRMPVMGGIELTQRIRASGRKDAKRIPIVALTANAFDSDKAEILKAGMNEHLSKPVKPEKLYDVIKDYIEGIR
ncbi:MAG: response regulator [Lachnospiraceae bacterium]|nr:response regulator [Lachnospiraceae bacterium]